MRDPHRFIITIGAAQPLRYLLRRPAQLELLFNKCAQRLSSARASRALGAAHDPQRPLSAVLGRGSALARHCGSPRAKTAVWLREIRTAIALKPSPASQAARRSPHALSLSANAAIASLPWPNTTSQRHTQRNVLRPEAELASNRPRRVALSPQLPHTLRSRSVSTTHPSLQFHRHHSPGSQARPPGCSDGAVDQLRHTARATHAGSPVPSRDRAART